MTDADDIRRKRLLYQATHRGFKEADILFGGFARAHIQALSAAELDAFEALLRFPDHDLFSWAKGGVAAPEEIDGPLLERLRAFDLAEVCASGESA